MKTSAGNEIKNVRGTGRILKKVVREGLSEKVSFELRSEDYKGVTQRSKRKTLQVGKQVQKAPALQFSPYLVPGIASSCL